MKKVQFYNNIIGSFLVFLIFGQTIIAMGGKNYMEKIKRIEKSYHVNADVEIEIDNKFGKVHVDTWDKNEVSLVIEIKVEDKNEEKAAARLEDIDIERDDDSPESLSFRTLMDEKWWEGNPITAAGTSMIGQKKVEINYTLSVPVSANLEIENRYGSVYISDLTGDVNVDVKYGNLKTKKLMGANSTIELSYGKGEIDQIDNAFLDIDYSKVEIEKSANMELECRYSGIEIEEVDVLEIDAKYGEVEIESVISIDGDFKYTGVSIEELLNDLDADIGYSPHFEIEYISSEFEFIDIDANFTSISLNFQENSNFELDAEASYGNISLPRRITSKYDLDAEDGRGEELDATIGGSGSSKKVSIDVSYGNISINKE